MHYQSLLKRALIFVTLLTMFGCGNDENTIQTVDLSPNETTVKAAKQQIQIGDDDYTVTIKVIINEATGANRYDFGTASIDVPFVDQVVLFSGSSQVDEIIIAPGNVYDLTNTKGSSDRIILDRQYVEYIDNIALDALTGNLIIKHQVGTNAQTILHVGVSRTAADILVFADGAVSTAEIKQALRVQQSLTNVAIDTTLTSQNVTSTTTNPAQVKMLAMTDEAVEFIPLSANSMHQVSGSSGVDKVFVSPTASMDLTNLKGSPDEIYFAATWEQYRKQINADGTMTFSLVQSGVTLSEVILTIGSNVASNDLLIFADGAVPIANAYVALQNNVNAAFEAIGGRDVTNLSRVDRERIDSDNDGVADAFDIAPFDASRSAQFDSDGDGVTDDIDVAPNDASIAKAIRFNLSNVANVGITESVAQPTTGENVFLKQRKVSENALISQAYANDDITTLANTSNAKTFDENGAPVADAILSSSPFFVAETVVTPNGRYAYLITSPRLQESISGLPPEVCNLYVVTLSDNSFECALDRSQPEPTPIQLIGNSRVWFDLKGIQFREDNTGLFNHGDDVYLMAPDFSLSKLPYNVSTEDYYGLTGYGWLDDDHIFMVMGCGAENCGALVLSAINVNTLQEVASVSRGENSGDGLIDFGQVSQLDDTIFVGSRAVRWTGTDFEAAQGGGIEAVVDQYGRSWAYEDNYDVGMPPKKLASLDGHYSVVLSQYAENNFNDQMFSGSGSGVVYKNFVFKEDYVLHKYAYSARNPIATVAGQAYTASTLYTLDNDDGYLIVDNRFSFWDYIPKANTSGDVEIPYTVKIGPAREQKTLVIPSQAIQNYLDEYPNPIDPNGYIDDLRQVTDGDTLRLFSPEPDRMGFCLLQLSSNTQQCALLEDYYSVTTFYDRLQGSKFFPQGYFDCPDNNCASGIQNLVFVGQSIYAYFRDDTDGQFYQATATINDFMQDGESALTFTPVTNTAGESEIMSGANALKLFSQGDIANVTASYTNQQLIIDFKQPLASQAQLPRFRVFAGEQSIFVSNAKINPVKPSELIIDLDLSQLSIGTEYSVEMLDFVFITAKSGRYSIESALTFTAIDDTGLYQDDDNDGVINKFDAYPNISLDGLADSDQDGIPDVCNRSCQQRGMVTDYDTDGDGYYNGPSLNIYSVDADQYNNWPALNEDRGYGQSFIAKGPVTSIGLDLDPSLNFTGGLKLYLYDFDSKTLLSTVTINETEGNVLSGLTQFPINNIGEANQTLIFMVHSTTNNHFNVLGGSGNTNNYGEGAFYSLSNISAKYDDPDFVISIYDHDTKVTVQYAPALQDAHPDDATQWLAQPAVSGKVIDGYIQGATVYLDLDYDGIIDSGEPSTVTTANGDYTLLLSDAQEACTAYAPLRVNVPVGAVDQDLGEVTKAYQMVLPPNLNMLQDGYDFNITPLSTVLWEQIHSYFEEVIGTELSCEIVRDNVTALSDVESSISSAIQNVVTHYNIPADQIFADFIANNNSTLADKAQLIVKGLQKSFAETQALKDMLPVGAFAEVRYFVFSSMDGDELYPNAWYREIQTVVDGNTFVELYKISDDLETNVRLIYRAERSSGSSASNSGVSYGLNKEIESRGGDDSPYECNYQESLNVYDGSKQYEVVNLTSHTSSSNDLGACTFDTFENSATSRYIFTPKYAVGDATYSAQFTFDYQYSKSEFPNVTDFAQFIDVVDPQVITSYVDSLPDEFCSENEAGAQSVVRSKNYSEGGNQVTVTRQGNLYTKKVTYPDGTSDETSYGAEDTPPVDDCVEVSEPPIETPTEQDQCGKYCEESVGLFYYHYALTNTPKTFPIHLGGNDIQLELAGGVSTGSFKFIDESDNEHLVQSPNIASDHPFLSALKTNSKALTLSTNGDNSLDNSFRIYRDDNLIGMINLVRDVGDTVSDIQLSHSKAIINRLSAGSGSRANNQCSEFAINDYAVGISHHGQISLVPDNVVVGGTMDLLGLGGENSFYVCDDTPLGTYNINMSAIDGVGGQSRLSMQIEVVEPTVDGGQLTWAQADYLGAGDNCDNAYCYEYDDTLMVFNAISTTPHTYSFSFSADIVFGESSSPHYINFNHNNQDYVLTNIAPECLGTDVRDCDNWNKGFDADVLVAFNDAINSRTVTMYSDYPHLTDEMFANVDGKHIRLTFIKNTGLDVSSLGDFSDDLVVYPVLEGTGTRDDNQCHEFDLYAINQDFDSSIRILAESNDLFGVTSARKITPCSDWAPGNHQIQLTAIDGLGGKKHVGTLNIEVKSEKVKQGRVMKRDCGANCVATSYGYMHHYALNETPVNVVSFLPSASLDLSHISSGGNASGELYVVDENQVEHLIEQQNFDRDFVTSLFNDRKTFSVKKTENNDLLNSWWLYSDNDYREGRMSFVIDKGQTVNDAVLINNTVLINRPIDGTGYRTDLDGQCSQLPIDNFLTTFSRNSNLTLVPDNRVEGGRMPLLGNGNEHDFYVCTDTPEGEYLVQFTALDGKGDKKVLDLTIEVASERVEGGSLTWSDTRELSPYIRISGNPDWVIYDCCGGSTLIPNAYDPEKGPVPHFYVANGNDGTILGFTTLLEYGGQGNPINVSSIRDTGYISFDFKYENAPDVGNSGWLLRVYSRPDTSEYVEVNLTNSIEGLTPSESWQTFTFKLSDLWPSGSLDLNNIHSIAIFPTWGQGDDAIYQVANLQFTAPAGMKAFNSADIYLRNSLDDWDTSTRFNYSGNGIYTANLDLTSGEEIQFKVAGSDWSNPNLGAPYDGDSAIASENSPFELATTQHNVKFTADLDTTYKFILDVSNEYQPTLTIVKTDIYSESSFTLFVNGDVNEDWALWDCCGGSTPILVLDEDTGNTVVEFAINNGNNGTVLGLNSRTSDGGSGKHIDVSSLLNSGEFRFDLKVVNAPATGNHVWMMQIQSNANQGEFVELNLNTSIEGENPSENWQTFTFDIRDLTNNSSLDPSGIDAIMIFPTWGTGADTVYRIDNMLFTGETTTSIDSGGSDNNSDNANTDNADDNTDTVNNPTTSLISDVGYVDSNIQSCILSESEQQGWSIVSEVTSINCADVQNIDDLKYFKNLERLILSFDKDRDVDLSAIRSLTKLDDLYLESPNSVTDLSPLSSLDNLSSLMIIHAPAVKDFNFLRNLSNLSSLVLVNTPGVADELSLFNSLANLDSLGIYDSGLTELGSITELGNLSFLGLAVNRIFDFGGLENLNNLQVIALPLNPIRHFNQFMGLSPGLFINPFGLPLLSNECNSGLLNSNRLLLLSELPDACFVTDFDNDLIDDDYEKEFNLNPEDSSDALIDSDGDGFYNLQEYHAGTAPNDTSDFPILLADIIIDNHAFSSCVNQQFNAQGLEFDTDIIKLNCEQVDEFYDIDLSLFRNLIEVRLTGTEFSLDSFETDNEINSPFYQLYLTGFSSLSARTDADKISVNSIHIFETPLLDDFEFLSSFTDVKEFSFSAKSIDTLQGFEHLTSLEKLSLSGEIKDLNVIRKLKETGLKEVNLQGLVNAPQECLDIFVEQEIPATCFLPDSNNNFVADVYERI